MIRKLSRTYIFPNNSDKLQSNMFVHTKTCPKDSAPLMCSPREHTMLHSARRTCLFFLAHSITIGMVFEWWFVFFYGQISPTAYVHFSIQFCFSIRFIFNHFILFASQQQQQIPKCQMRMPYNFHPHSTHSHSIESMSANESILQWNANHVCTFFDLWDAFVCHIIGTNSAKELNFLLLFFCEPEINSCTFRKRRNVET